MCRDLRLATILAVFRKYFQKKNPKKPKKKTRNFLLKKTKKKPKKTQVILGEKKQKNQKKKKTPEPFFWNPKILKKTLKKKLKKICWTKKLLGTNPKNPTQKLS